MQLPHPPTDEPNALGARYGRLVIDVFVTCDRLSTELWQHPLLVGDGRTSSRMQMHRQSCADAAELDVLQSRIDRLAAHDARTAMASLHNRTMTSLAALQDAARDRFEQATRHANLISGFVTPSPTHRPASDYDGVPASRLGEWYADCTYWVIGAVSSVQALAMTIRGQDNDGWQRSDTPAAQLEEDMRHAVNQLRHADDLLADLEGIASRWQHLGDAELAVMLFDFHEKTTTRTRLVAEVVERKLVPFTPHAGNQWATPETPCTPPAASANGTARDDGPDAHPDDGFWSDVDATGELPDALTDEAPDDGFWSDRDATDEDPYELGETYAAIFSFGLDETSQHLDRARAHLRHLTDIGAALDRMSGSDRLTFLLGLHHHAHDRLTSSIRFAERLLAAPEEDTHPLPLPENDNGWPTHSDVVAGRHNGVRWIVPRRDRYR